MAASSSNLKSLVVDAPILKYILEKNAYPKEHQQLKELREITTEKYGKRSIMNVPADEAQFLSMLLKIMNAKKTMEIGVFTGYSLLATALALPDDGQRLLWTENLMKLDCHSYKKQELSFIQSDAFSVLDDLINGEEEVRFDFIFVDAKKEEYMKFHEKVMKLVRIGGIIAYDNTLWFGSVAYKQEDKKYSEMPEYTHRSKDYVIQFNNFLVSDYRVESTLLSIGDGLTLCRRLY
ncbi:Flavonoid 3',5'-methyltransferase [Hibiscus syriacus]|uniref:Flavonoid 3',5'-methyltransferase n=1 Tax=Hibiscus syriacus TaxID=106335 RepID=A0A6A2Z765_HIBSY|nr:Flavonoid 3',5'-methyltransferase [Hibiscus syriacus]